MIQTPFLLSAKDPGGTTGLTLFHVEEEHFSLVEADAVPYRKGQPGPIPVLARWAEQHLGVPHVLVYEDFHVRPVRGPVDTTAIAVLGELKAFLWGGEGNEALAEVAGLLEGLRYFTRIDGLPILQEAIDKLTAQLPDPNGTGPYDLVVPQTPAEAKRLVTDDILKRLGLWEMGFGADSVHVRDAARHALTWLAQQKYMPLCRAAWPPATTLR